MRTLPAKSKNSVCCRCLPVCDINCLLLLVPDVELLLLSPLQLTVSPKVSASLLLPMPLSRYEPCALTDANDDDSVL